MILFRCSCGAGYGVDNRYAGGTAQCEQCGQRVPIPAESDPSVLLIYKAGQDAEGAPMARDEVERALLTGELASSDLIWHENTWYPLRDFLGDQMDDAAPHPSGDGNAKALEEVIGELEPMHIAVTVEDEKREETPAPKRKRGLNFLRFGKKAREGEDAGGEGRQEKQKKTLVQHVLQVLAVLLILGVAYRFGFGPLISGARDMTTYVVVHNHEDIEYNVKLGWRALLGSSSYKAVLSAQSVCSFEIDVGMPEKQGLKLTPVEEGKGEPFKLRVPLRPGRAIMVNLRQKGTYAVFDIGKASAAQVGGALAKLASQIANGQPPASAPQVADAILAVGKGSLVGTVDELFLSSDDYNLPAIASFGKRISAIDSAKPALSWLPAYRLNFKNGYCNYEHKAPNKLEGGVRLPEKTVKVSAGRTIAIDPKSSPMIEFRGNSNSPQLSLRLDNQTVTLDKKVFRGTWSYGARRAPGKTPKWTSSWSFAGATTDAKYRVRVTVDANNQERSKVQ